MHYAALDAHSLLALLDAMSLVMESRIITGVLNMYQLPVATSEPTSLAGPGGSSGSCGDRAEDMAPSDRPPAWTSFTYDRGQGGGMSSRLFTTASKNIKAAEGTTAGGERNGEDSPLKHKKKKNKKLSGGGATKKLNQTKS